MVTGFLISFQQLLLSRGQKKDQVIAGDTVVSLRMGECSVCSGSKEIASAPHESLYQQHGHITNRSICKYPPWARHSRRKLHSPSACPEAKSCLSTFTRVEGRSSMVCSQLGKMGNSPLKEPPRQLGLWVAITLTQCAGP